MGTEISLDIGGVSICWAKNNRGADHGFLFQASDRQRFQSDQIAYDEVEPDDPEIAEMEIGFARPLRKVVPRLELLGYTLDTSRKHYAAAVASCLDEREALQEYGNEQTHDLMSFEEFIDFVRSANLESLDNQFVYGSNDEDDVKVMGRFSDDPRKSHLPHYSPHHRDSWSERSYFGNLIGFLHPYTLLRVLAENEQNLDARLEWHYGPLVSNGWAEESEFEHGVRRRQTYLIATEGSSDIHILKKAFELLRPEVVDFFRFIDVSERHPFSGTGSLVKFAEGLAKIDVQNQTLFLLDNDAEGKGAYIKIRELPLPTNMRTMMLPHLEAFKSFPTVGPAGDAPADINGRAAAIECYLDLEAEGLPPPRVRWSNFKEDLGVYHGALEAKERYAKKFLEAARRGGDYNFSNIDKVLTAIIAECTAMAEQSLNDGCTN